LTDPATESPIALGLFDRVRDYARLLAKDGLSTKKPLKRDATIIVFCQTFFQQFFEYKFAYELTAVDAQAKLEATRLRVAAEQDGVGDEAIALVRSFEDLCDMWPDVLGFTYGGLSTEFRRFHVDYIPRLLKRISGWATADGLADIATAAQSASGEWDKAAKRV
jgi:hypothetical protein